jgi:hypothetical protein
MFSFAWINHIHKILNDSGMSYIWTLQNCISEKWLKLVIKNNLIDQFKQIWNSSIETSSKGAMILCLFIWTNQNKVLSLINSVHSKI